MTSFSIYRCEHCGRIYRYGKWMFVKELRPDVADTFKIAESLGYIEYDYDKKFNKCICQQEGL